MHAVCGQRGEVDGERGGKGRNEQAVLNARKNRNIGVCQHVVQVCHEGLAGQEGEAALNLIMVARRVDNQHIEEEQAEEAENRQDEIADDAAGNQLMLAVFCTLILYSLRSHFFFLPSSPLDVR